MTVLMVALLGSFMVPLSASADGTSGDPPMEAPTYDTVPSDPGDTAGDSSEGFSGEPEAGNTSSGDGLLYELMTLILLV
jgi:hypothetical protein